MLETTRLADQIRRASEGEAWHGDSLREILRDVNATQAAARPIPDAHTTWELVLHITAWDKVVLTRTGRTAAMPTDDENFPKVKDSSEAAWRVAKEQLWKTHDQLVKAVAGFPDARLMERVPGKTHDYYNFFYMFSGIVQHELYHAGQIALLKKFR
jgi:DinB superfamily